MHTHRQKFKAGLAATGAVAAIALLAPAGAGAAPGGCGGGGLTSATTDICTPTQKARLLPNGMVIPPKSAPARVKRVVAFANRIRSKPYIYGGGHARWWDRGYDCSGAVSYALRGGKFIKSPLPSGSLARGWGEPGEGRWITVYANGGHAYVVIAGIRFDTSGSGGRGPRWRTDLRGSAGFTARHPAGGF